MKIGFIGFGNMGQAIARGMTACGGVRGGDIYAFAQRQEKLKKAAAELGVNPVGSASELARSCEMIIIALTPDAVEPVLGLIAEELRGKILVSIAAGYDFERYEALLPLGLNHISTIPNIPISVGAGILACEDRHSLSAEQYAAFKTVFGKIALIEQVPAAQFSIAGTLGGCTPAYTAMYVEALADAAVKHGMSRKASYRIAEQMLIGTGKLLLEKDMHPAELKDLVCSPGGTTIKGVAVLENKGFRGAVIRAIDAAEE